MLGHILFFSKIKDGSFFFWNLFTFDNFMQAPRIILRLKGGMSIDADSGPLEYVLWCCGSRSWEVFTFFQIGSGHTVIQLLVNRLNESFKSKNFEMQFQKIYETVVILTWSESKIKVEWHVKQSRLGNNNISHLKSGIFTP